MKSKYQVGIQIYNSFEVEANSEKEAEEIVRELSIESTLRDSDYTITYVDEIKSSMQSSDEREKAINHTA